MTEANNVPDPQRGNAQLQRADQGPDVPFKMGNANRVDTALATYNGKRQSLVKSTSVCLVRATVARPRKGCE